MASPVHPDSTPLSYERPSSVQVAWQTLPDSGVRIVVPTLRREPRSHLAFAVGVVGHGDLFGLLLAPVLVPLLWLVHLLLASDKPRAVLTLDRQVFTLTERSDDGLGWFARTRSWPRASIGELRKNQFGRMLFLRIPGKVSYDLLGGLPDAAFDEVIRLLEPAVSATLPSTPSPSMP